MSLTYKRELITPQRARQLLDSMPENQRKPKPSKIPGYARDMAASRWDSNSGETIKIDTRDMMIDGQNRCLAVIMSGTPTYFDVVYDVPTTAMPVLDSGASRSTADAMAILGVQARDRATSIVRWSMLWDAKQFLGQGGRVNPTRLEIMERYQEEPGLYNAATSRATDCQSQGLATGSAAGMAYYLFHHISEEETKNFFDQYISGANLPDLSPVLTLTKRMRRIKVDRISRPEQLALFIRAWNAFRENRTLTQIVITSSAGGGGKLTNDNFPMPR